MKTTFARKLNKRLCHLLALALIVTSISAIAGETVRYVHTDHLGTPVVWTDQNGDVIKTSEYEPYGLQVSGPVEDGPGYTGHVEDAATGLTYMQQRYYDPQIGMFLSVDPVTAYGNPVGQFNRYRYANGNPYMYTDPDGRDSFMLLRATFTIAAADATTPDPSDAAAPAKAAAYTGALLGTAIGGVIHWGITTVMNETNTDTGESESPSAPEGLVGEQDKESRTQGSRHNSGPLSAGNGGTGNAESDFGELTGGAHAPAPDEASLPAGSLVGKNGVIYRPGTSSSGPRIDIPASGDKPHETLHYPVLPPSPDKGQ